MNKTMLKELGEEVRKQGRSNEVGPSLKDLVYDVETGEFGQMGKGEVVPSTGNIVTEMTREGFAYEA